MGKIPCVYVGETPLRLSPHGTYHDGDGKPLTSRDIMPGHTLMMPDEEVLGMTIWHDPRGILPSEKIGVGRVVKAEHQGLDLETLMALGYEMHDGRTDIIPVEQWTQQQNEVKAKAEKAATQAPATEPTPAPTVPAMPVSRIAWSPAPTVPSTPITPTASSSDDDSSEQNEVQS